MRRGFLTRQPFTRRTRVPKPCIEETLRLGQQALDRLYEALHVTSECLERSYRCLDESHQALQATYRQPFCVSVIGEIGDGAFFAGCGEG